MKYLANFFTGSMDNESLARVLVYPRVLGTSINTTFGTQMQYFVNEVLGSQGSLSSGIDIEFVDRIDGMKKYCQIKAGPETIVFDTNLLENFSRLKVLQNWSIYIAILD